MKPRKFDTVEAAVRWATYGGVALFTGNAAYEGAALYASPAQNSEAVGWARWWAGKAGVSLAEIKERGKHNERCELDWKQTAFLAAQCLEGPCSVGSLPTTVVFFTGTRKGTSHEQIDGLREWLFNRDILSGHHGCCIGADEDFHNIVRGLRVAGEPVPWLVGWPAEVPPDLTCAGRIECDDLKLTQSPLARNKNMAAYARYHKENNARNCLTECVACPLEDEPPDTGRGGTWHAIRAFKAAGIPVTIINRDGSIRNE